MRRQVSLALAGFLLGAAVLAAACGDDSDGSTSSGAGGSTGEIFGGGGCDTCVAEACSPEISSCEADAGCSAWLRCLRACPIGHEGDVDAACEAACPVEGSAAAVGRDGVVACRRSGAGSSCATCGTSPTGSTGSGGPWACPLPAAVEQTCQPAEISDPCIRCIQEECCDSYRDVFSAGPTRDLADCWYACPSDDADCSNACYLEHPEGVTGFGIFRACVDVKCNATGACVGGATVCLGGATGTCQDGIDDCGVCQREECTCEATTCWTDVECHPLYACVLSCTDAICEAACIAARPGGETLFDNLAVCSAQNCVQRCGTG